MFYLTRRDIVFSMIFDLSKNSYRNSLRLMYLVLTARFPQISDNLAHNV